LICRAGSCRIVRAMPCYAVRAGGSSPAMSCYATHVRASWFMPCSCQSRRAVPLACCAYSRAVPCYVVHAGANLSVPCFAMPCVLVPAPSCRGPLCRACRCEALRRTSALPCMVGELVHAMVCHACRCQLVLPCAAMPCKLVPSRLRPVFLCRACSCQLVHAMLCCVGFMPARLSVPLYAVRARASPLVPCLVLVCMFVLAGMCRVLLCRSLARAVFCRAVLCRAGSFVP